MRYYSTQRPIVPGSYPKVPNNNTCEIVNFAERAYCDEIGRDAWGVIEYIHALSPEDVRDYELVAANS